MKFMAKFIFVSCLGPARPIKGTNEALVGHSIEGTITYIILNISL